MHALREQTNSRSVNWRTSPLGDSSFFNSQKDYTVIGAPKLDCYLQFRRDCGICRYIKVMQSKTAIFLYCTGTTHVFLVHESVKHTCNDWSSYLMHHSSLKQWYWYYKWRKVFGVRCGWWREWGIKRWQKRRGATKMKYVDSIPVEALGSVIM